MATVLALCVIAERLPQVTVMTAGVADYLRGDRAHDRVSSTAPIDATALALVGACMHHALLGFFTNRQDSRNRDETFRPLAAEVVEALMQGISP